MGVRNAKAAIAQWGPRLGRHHASRVALTVMAIKTRDSDVQPTYFAGFEPIAEALGATGEQRTRINVVNRALRPLIQRGAIEVLSASGNGRRTTYALKLDQTMVIGNDGTSLAPRSSQNDDHDDDERAADGRALRAPWSPVTAALVIADGGPKKKGEEEADRASSLGFEAPQAMHAYAVPGERHALLRFAGDGSSWLKAQGVPAMRTSRHRGFFLRRERLADVLALAERDHIITRLHHRDAS